jgi:hypothetical protein
MSARIALQPGLACETDERCRDAAAVFALLVVAVPK